MSNVLAPSTSPIARNIPSLPAFHNWDNRLPSTFSQLDNRVAYLSSETNRILEMHPNGTRGVHSHTEYCMLTIYVLTILNATLGSSWAIDKGSSSDWDIQVPKRGQVNSLHVIMGNKTGLFLCMDNRSVPYQRHYRNDSKFSEECYFNHEQIGIRESYYRTHQTVNGIKKWYLGINRDGSIRCGNVTRSSQKSARFIKQNVPIKHNPPEPYTRSNKPCCPKDKCGKGKKRCKGEKKCRSKSWCKKKRRHFFKLSLKELKRYYNRCIKERERKIRHSRNRRNRRNRKNRRNR